MTLSTDAISPETLPARSRRRTAETAGEGSLLKAHMELGKVRLNALVVFTTALGFVLGHRQVETYEDLTRVGINWNYWSQLGLTCLGVFLAAVGASAFNQAIETRRDARMHRTRNRPLCTGRLSRTYAASFGLITSIMGVSILCPAVNGLSAVLASFNVLLYALMYTPLKPKSTINTLVGAVVGAVPPMIGWVAATNDLAAGAWVLGAILFVWQIPHFLALCWMYREDYARGGFKMLPIVDESGRLTSRMALMYALMLAPLCISLWYLRLAGEVFVVTSLIMTGAMILAAMRFVRTRTNPDARKLFFASIIYLPVLCIVLMADSRGRGSSLEVGPSAVVQQTHDAFISPDSPEGQQIINSQLQQQKKQ